MTLVCVMFLPHASVNVQLSVTLPPHAPGKVPRVDVTVPAIRQEPLELLLEARALGTAASQATVIGTAAANTAGGAGSTVMTLVCVMVLPHASVNVHLSMTLPPHAPGKVPRVDVTVPAIRQEPLALLV